MPKDYQIERCRIFYFKLRKTIKNAPVMIALKHPWGWMVETKDGSFFQEYCEQTHCSWCVKAEGLLKWNTEKESGGLRKGK